MHMSAGRTAGLMKPTGPLPAEMRASLTAAIMDAKMGAAADVPPLRVNLPPRATTVGYLRKPSFRTSSNRACAVANREHVPVG